jgi:hypothetical protein
MKKSTIAVTLLGLALAANCHAGQATKWADLPDAVRATVLANGGKEGQSVDNEGEKTGGQDTYEASVKDKDGNTADLVITADGKLVETKHDDAADAAGERASRAKKVLAGVKFSHPRDITNPYLPLAYLKQDIIEGSEDGKKTRVERTLKPDVRKTFKVAGQNVESLCMEDRVFVGGVLEEVALDYFAQDDAGTVYYLGEDVDEYDETGKLAKHNPTDDAWLTGKDTPVPGVIIPAHPKVGDKFKSEDVSAKIDETDEVVALDETTTVPAGKFEHCVKIKETLADGSIEFKLYAPGVGVVRETPSTGDEVLTSHTASGALLK